MVGHKPKQKPQRDATFSTLSKGKETELRVLSAFATKAELSLLLRTRTLSRRVCSSPSAQSAGEALKC